MCWTQERYFHNGIIYLFGSLFTDKSLFMHLLVSFYVFCLMYSAMRVTREISLKTTPIRTDWGRKWEVLGWFPNFLLDPEEKIFDHTVGSTRWLFFTTKLSLRSATAEKGAPFAEGDEKKPWDCSQHPHILKKKSSYVMCQMKIFKDMHGCVLLARMDPDIRLFISAKVEYPHLLTTFKGIMFTLLAFPFVTMIVLFRLPAITVADLFFTIISKFSFLLVTLTLWINLGGLPLSFDLFFRFCIAFYCSKCFY